MSRFPAAFRLPALASWSSFARWGAGPSSRSAYRLLNFWPDPNGVVTLRTHEMRPGWVPSVPRGLRYPHGWRGFTDRRTPPFNGRCLYPGTTTHRRGLLERGITEGSQMFTPSGLPLACDHRMER